MYDLNTSDKIRFDIGIVTAVETEFKPIFDKMKLYGEVKEFLENEGTKAEKKFYYGKLRGQNCILSVAGIGTEDAAICTERMIDKYNAERIINVGSAGTNLESKVNVGDCVISDKCVRFDVDISIIPEYKKGSYEKGADPFYNANPNLVEFAYEAGNKINLPCHIGTIITGNSFINDPVKKKETLEEFGALCDEMEGAAVAKCCTERQIPFVVIRCISDKPVKKEEVMYYNHFDDAAKRCADLVEGMMVLLTKQKNRDIIEKIKKDVNKIKTSKIENKRLDFEI